MKNRTNRSIFCTLAVAAAGTGAWAQPTPVVPPGFEAPGPFPTTLCGAIFDIRNASLPQEPDQGGEDNMFFSVPGSGPFFFTSSRNNGGDFGINISPFFGPGDPQSFPPQPANNFQAASGGTVYAWRPSYSTGLLFATARSNGNSTDYVYNGTPITLHLTASVGNESSAHGYSMNTGIHTTAGGADERDVDLLLGCAGIPDRQEAVGNAAVAYFPFTEGWIGGHWDFGVGGWQNGAASPGLPESVVFENFNDFTFVVTLPGVDSASDGLVFFNSTQTNSNLKTAHAYPNNGGWTLFLRDDEDADVTGLTVAQDFNLSFSFVYVPFSGARVIAAHIDGDDGSTVNGQGGYTLTRLGEGQYALVIPDKSDTSGMLMLSSYGLMANTSTLPDRTFLSYAWDGANSRFVIESREIIPDGNTPWGRTPTLRDGDFAFAWVDFANPMSPNAPECTGDVDGDGDVDLSDLALLLANFGTPSGATVGDVDGDGDVDLSDLAVLLANFGMTC